MRREPSLRLTFLERCAANLLKGKEVFLCAFSKPEMEGNGVVASAQVCGMVGADERRYQHTHTTTTRGMSICHCRKG